MLECGRPLFSQSKEEMRMVRHNKLRPDQHQGSHGSIDKK